MGPTGGARREQRQREDNGLAFVQDGEEVKEEGDTGAGVLMAQANINAPDYCFKDEKCYHCNEQGHIARDCPKLADVNERGQIHAQFGIGLLQGGIGVKRSCLYLDTCTTND